MTTITGKSKSAPLLIGAAAVLVTLAIAVLGKSSGGDAASAATAAASPERVGHPQPPAGVAGDERRQFIPLATFRVGAYASSGVPVWGSSRTDASRPAADRANSALATT